MLLKRALKVECLNLLTFLRSVESNVELLHAVIDERDLVVRHEAVARMLS